MLVLFAYCPNCLNPLRTVEFRVDSYVVYKCDCCKWEWKYSKIDKLTKEVQVNDFLRNNQSRSS